MLSYFSSWGGVLVTTNNLNGKFNWFSSKLWIVPSVVGVIALMYATSLDIQNNLGSLAYLKDIGKLMITPALFLLVNNINTRKITTNKVFQFAKEFSFFAYAGHFLFCSMILHTIATQLGFIETGKFTLLVFCFCCIGVPFMACVYLVGKKLLPTFVKLYDGTL